MSFVQGHHSCLGEERQQELRSCLGEHHSCLLEELLTRVRDDEVPDRLWELQRSCLSERVEDRPTAAMVRDACG